MACCELLIPNGGGDGGGVGVIPERLSSSGGADGILSVPLCVLPASCICAS